MTTKQTNNYCIILAGGKGRRLWPCSRERMPKQFIDFFGCGRTQLQQTYDRFAKIVPQENIFVNTNSDYANTVREQLPQLSENNLMVEPIHRNTAAGAAWSVHRIAKLNAEANIVITPSDQIVMNEDAFASDMNKGFEFVSEHDRVLTIGVKPTRPEPGYGYIQIGDEVSKNIFNVKSFTEKPEREFARIFMENGEFYWNAGVFISNAQHFAHCFSEILPPLLRKFDEETPEYSIEKENAFIRENFPSYPNLSLDYGLLEKTENVCVMQCEFGWADLGTWHGIYEAMHKGEGDNVVVDSDVIFDNAHDNVICLPKGRLAVINGLEGYIVAEEDNVLLICKKEDSSALVRKFVNEVQIKKGEKYV